MKDDSKGARAWLRDQGKHARRDTTPAIGLGLAGIGLAVVQAGSAAVILRAALAGGSPTAWPFVTFGAAALLRAAILVIADRKAVQAGAQARRRLRTDALARLVAAGPALLRTTHSAELATTIVDRIDALDGFFARWMPAATIAWAGPVLVLLATAIADWHAALILGATGLLVPIAQALSGIGAALASRRQFAALSRLQARFLDRVRGIATIVLAGRAADEAATLARAADELRRRTMRVLRVAFIASAALDCALALALVTIALRYGLQATQPGFDPGRALFVLLLIPEFFAPLRAFSAAYQDKMHAQGAADALAALPPMPVPPEAAPVIRTIAAHGVSITFEDVGFTWDPARGPALQSISFRVPTGETMVLAGPSGSGKSTIIEILLGFIRPETGRVLINGNDIASIVPEALARMTAWIGQRPMLFAGTLRENIAFARPDATDREIETAARNARIMAFAETLPEGLDTMVGEGGFGLSGGQAQRVAIARAFLKDAPLLLLDEPTAHLDPATEGEVIESLRHLAINRTVVLASHAAAAQAFGSRRLDLRDGRAAATRGAA